MVLNAELKMVVADFKILCVH